MRKCWHCTFLVDGVSPRQDICQAAHHSSRQRNNKTRCFSSNFLATKCECFLVVCHFFSSGDSGTKRGVFYQDISEFPVKIVPQKVVSLFAKIALHILQGKCHNKPKHSCISCPDCTLKSGWFFYRDITAFLLA